MRQARRALIFVPLAMSAALIATVLASYLTVREVLVTLGRGQGDTILDSVRRSGDVDEARAELEKLLRERAAEGLRCAALFERTRLLAAVGDCAADGEEALQAALAEARPDEVVDLGSRVRMVRGAPPALGALPSRRPLLVEFEPLMTRELERSALRSLGIGGAASLALIVVALGLWRLSLRQERLKESVERDRRLASLGEMAAVLAHEIRNPLASMKGHAQLLAERLKGSAQERGKADRVVREAVRLEELTSDLLSFIRAKQIERRPVDPAEVARAAAAEVDPGRVELQLAAAPPEWSLDPQLMKQVLTNLLRNAVQASPDGEKAEASVELDGGKLVITIRDRGDGVLPGDRERVFEPFYTTRLRGTGLGLAVARRIVALHGGGVTIGNHPDGGAIFRVTVPQG